MKESSHIRDLYPQSRPRARRVRLWYIRMATRRRGIFLVGRNPPPGGVRDIDDATTNIACQVASDILPRMNRATWREHRRKCAKHGVVLPKSVHEAEVAANMLRQAAP